jgi:hypothetical protein
VIADGVKVEIEKSHIAHVLSRTSESNTK